MNNFFKRSVRIVSFVALAAGASTARAISIDFPSNFAEFSSQDIKTTISNIVRIIIGFLGILVILAILFGGFKMMTSRGDSEGMESGRKIVVAGAIGLIIVLAAYAIAGFVVNSLSNAV